MTTPMEYDVVYGHDELNSAATFGWQFCAFLGRDNEGDAIYLVHRKVVALPCPA